MRREPSKLGGEKIFRQTKQKSARRVYPLRRVFVKRPQGRDDGKDSADSPCDEFLEVPLTENLWYNGATEKPLPLGSEAARGE